MENLTNYTHLKFEPRRVMSKNDFRIKTLLIERIKVGAINDFYSEDMLRADNNNACPECGQPIGQYHKKCTIEMCPRCGELRGHCRCTEEYAVYIVESESKPADNKQKDNKMDSTKSDEIFNSIIESLKTRVDRIENKLNELLLSKPNFAEPTSAPQKRRQLQDPIYMTSRDGLRNISNDSKRSTFK